MTERERKEICNLADMIKGEINRMCVTDDLAELDNMAFYAMKNIERLQSIRYEQMQSDRKEDADSKRKNRSL